MNKSSRKAACSARGNGQRPPPIRFIMSLPASACGTRLNALAAITPLVPFACAGVSSGARARLRVAAKSLKPSAGCLPCECNVSIPVQIHTHTQMQGEPGRPNPIPSVRLTGFPPLAGEYEIAWTEMTSQSIGRVLHSHVFLSSDCICLPLTKITNNRSEISFLLLAVCHVLLQCAPVCRNSKATVTCEGIPIVTTDLSLTHLHTLRHTVCKEKAKETKT